MARSGSWRSLRLPLLVALVVATALSFAGVFFQVTGGGGHGHAHADLSVIATAADSLGVVLAALLVAQLMVGYRLVAVTRPRFRPVHVAFAWAVIALLVAHGSLSVVHSLEPPLEALPLALDGFGLLLTALLVPQLLSGYRRKAGSPRPRVAHAAVALVLIAVAVAHAFGATYHALTG